MGLYEESIQSLLRHSTVKNWNAIGNALERALTRQPVAWHFPIKACEAVGAPVENALPAVAAITCAHMALILIDDLLDEDPRGAYLHLGVGRAANLALGLNTLGISILLEAKDCKERVRAAAALNEMMQRTAYGQDLDVQNAQTEEAYWAATRSKSSPYFAAALYIGALFGDANSDTASQLKRFGEIFGEIMQIHDDLNDTLASPANVDWLKGRSPLPILFAQIVPHPERERFIQLRTQVEDPKALKEAQSILVGCGAISYCINELISRHKQASSLLEDMRLSDPQPLMQLLEEAIAPIRHLFTEVGADFKEENN